MILFDYLYYRMYRAYAARNDDPGVRTFQYVSLALFFVLLGSWLLVEPRFGTGAAQSANWGSRYNGILLANSFRARLGERNAVSPNLSDQFRAINPSRKDLKRIRQ